VDNLLTLMIAGHTTTAAAMMWSVMFLHENRETQNVLRVGCCSYSSETMDPNPIKDFFIILCCKYHFGANWKGQPLVSF